MAGKRKQTAAVAFGLVVDLADRLAAAGMSTEQMPDLDEALRLVWPLAKRLAKLERSGKSAARTAIRAREALLAAAVFSYRAAPWWTWPEFRPDEWHVALVPGPPPDRQREVA